MAAVKVLIVDDFEDNIFLLEEILSALDMITTSVHNGQEAVDAVKASDFDLVLMDIEMPVMNGFEAAEEIRELDSPKNAVPIIAISAHNHDFFIERLDKCGINDYISKPYTLSKLNSVFSKFGF